MYVDSNHPYQYVSKNNSVVDGGLIGAVIGAGIAGSAIGVSGLNYRGIENRRDHQVSKIDKNLNKLEDARVAQGQSYSQKMNILRNMRMPLADSLDDHSIGRKLIEGYNSVIDDRVNKTNDQYSNRISKLINQSSDLKNQKQALMDPSYVKNAQQNHIYNKIGGWRAKAGIIGASAVVGGGLGVITDAILG